MIANEILSSGFRKRRTETARVPPQQAAPWHLSPAYTLEDRLKGLADSHHWDRRKTRDNDKTEDMMGE
ncbi:hypothetical protein LJC46_09625 [Desulfovibrio sp. OttesenSCG-928-G15]|nr:hypothetical protein [Desulfovibrio sp. OttesenSCG-928-G15]